jgi:hypothetical protein
VAFAATQAVLWALRRPTLSRRRRARIAVAAWAALLIGHIAYEAASDRIADAAAEGFVE